MKKSQVLTLVLLALITVGSFSTFIVANNIISFALKLPFKPVAIGYFATIYLFFTGTYAIYVFDGKRERKNKSYISCKSNNDDNTNLIDAT